MGKRVGVILSGCGVHDGAEIHESVCAMLALDRAGAEVVLAAPNRDQMHVINHLTGEPTEETRNVLVESARIARGEIRDLAELGADELDAVLLPGGFGAAKNLCDFATAGKACTVDSEVERLLRDMHAQRKPIAALCIAPAILARIFGRDVEPTVTIGNDVDTAKAIQSMGAKHRNSKVTDVVIDRDAKIVTSPCYMLAGRISDVATGAERAVTALLDLISEKDATAA